MATTKNGRAHTAAELTSLGLLANGCAGGWSIDVDESTSGPDQWFLQFQGPSIYVNFEIPSLDTVEQMRLFLSSRPRQTEPASGDELTVGSDKNAPVQLRRDDEFDDRFFLVIGAGRSPSVHYTLAGSDLKSIVAALEQIREDLE
jgi:hypothetical protein